MTETTNETVRPEFEQGIVIYTDAGVRPVNPGKMGWGVHGYRYTTEPSKQGPGLPTHQITSRGYIGPGQKPSHPPVVVAPIEYYDFFGSSLEIGSNNAAEVDALYYALLKLKTADVKSFQIYTDSEYLRRGLEEWVEIWKMRDWRRQDGTDVPNTMNWQRLLNEVDEIRAMGIDLSIDWVKGHRDNFGNIIADKLATIGVLYSMDQILRGECKISPAKGYWKSDVSRHPFINFKRLYFNTGTEFNTHGHYYIAEPGNASGTDEFIVGKKMPETSYAVLKLKEADVVIESIRQHQCQVANDVNSVAMMRLDKVYAPDVYPYLEEHGKYSMVRASKSNLSLNFIDNKPLTVELNPAGLSLRAIECFSLLEELLARYERHQLGQFDHATVNMSFEVHDITSVFYEHEEKSKKKGIETTLKADITVGFKDVMVPVSVKHRDSQCEIGVPLVLGADLLPRNNLKRIETLTPKVQLLTWKESETSIRYACVIETVSGIGIWSNFFADRIFLLN